MDIAVACAVYKCVLRSITNVRLCSLSVSLPVPGLAALNAVHKYAVPDKMAPSNGFTRISISGV